MIEISEMYCATQGEGKNMGRPSIFLRLHRCPLSCDWCDSKFTWDKNDPGYAIHQTYSPEVLVQELVKLAQTQRHWPEGLVITGGEPLIYQRELPEVIERYAMARFEHDEWSRTVVEIETAGTIVPSMKLVSNTITSFNVSPKLNSAGNERILQEKLWNKAALARYTMAERATFKLVVGEGDEMSLALFLSILQRLSIHTIGWPSMARRVYLMPEGTTVLALAERQGHILDLAMEHGVNATTRMQVVAHDDERRR